MEGVAIATGGFSGSASSQAFNPLLTSGGLAPWIAIGMTTATLLIAVMARAALKGERAAAVQSATGFFYLSLVTAFTAEVAVKTVLPRVAGQGCRRARAPYAVARAEAQAPAQAPRQREVR